MQMKSKRLSNSLRGSPLLIPLKIFCFLLCVSLLLVTYTTGCEEGQSGGTRPEGPENGHSAGEHGQMGANTDSPLTLSDYQNVYSPPADFDLWAITYQTERSRGFVTHLAVALTVLDEKNRLVLLSKLDDASLDAALVRSEDASIEYSALDILASLITSHESLLSIVERGASSLASRAGEGMDPLTTRVGLLIRSGLSDEAFLAHLDVLDAIAQSQIAGGDMCAAVNLASEFRSPITTRLIANIPEHPDSLSCVIECLLRHCDIESLKYIAQGNLSAHITRNMLIDALRCQVNAESTSNSYQRFSSDRSVWVIIRALDTFSVSQRRASGFDALSEYKNQGGIDQDFIDYLSTNGW